MTISQKLGFRILPSPPPLDGELLRQFRGIASSTVADAMGRFNFMDPYIKMRSQQPLCGVAITVNTRPADNLMVHKALELCRPGEIVVVNAGGDTRSAMFGELMCHSAVAAQLGGLVVDGALRDVDGLTRLKFPAFSRSVSPGSCDKDGPGEINVPISCGGVVVCPGDLVVGDVDGVAVVPRANVAQVLESALLLLDRETKRIAEIAAGMHFKAEINETLRRHGVIQ